MDRIVDLRIYPCGDTYESWGIHYVYESGHERCQRVGSRAVAIAIAAKMRRRPQLRVIEGGLSKAA